MNKMPCVICNINTSHGVIIDFTNKKGVTINQVELCGKCAKKRLMVDIGHQPPINYDMNNAQLISITKLQHANKWILSDVEGTIEVKP